MAQQRGILPSWAFEDDDDEHLAECVAQMVEEMQKNGGPQQNLTGRNQDMEQLFYVPTESSVKTLGTLGGVPEVCLRIMVEFVGAQGGDWQNLSLL